LASVALSHGPPPAAEPARCLRGSFRRRCRRASARGAGRSAASAAFPPYQPAVKGSGRRRRWRRWPHGRQSGANSTTGARCKEHQRQRMMLNTLPQPALDGCASRAGWRRLTTMAASAATPTPTATPSQQADKAGTAAELLEPAGTAADRRHRRGSCRGGQRAGLSEAAMPTARPTPTPTTSSTGRVRLPLPSDRARRGARSPHQSSAPQSRSASVPHGTRPHAKWSLCAQR